MLYDIGMVEILPFANTVTGNPGKGRDRNLPITFCFRRHLITDQAILTQIFNLYTTTAVLGSVLGLWVLRRIFKLFQLL